MNKVLLLAAGAAAVFATVPASASHIYFSNVAINGVALDSVNGETNPLFTVNQGGTLQFTVDGDGSGGDFINVSINGFGGMSPNNFSFAFNGGFASFSQTLTFNTLGSFSGSAFIDIPSSFPDYRAPDGNNGGDTRTLGFRVDVVDANTGVPEPASWAMLIAGFGLVGASMRRRRAVVAA